MRKKRKKNKTFLEYIEDLWLEHLRPELVVEKKVKIKLTKHEYMKEYYIKNKELYHKKYEANKNNK